MNYSGTPVNNFMVITKDVTSLSPLLSVLVLDKSIKKCQMTVLYLATYQPTNPVIVFKSLANKKIFIL